VPAHPHPELDLLTRSDGRAQLPLSLHRRTPGRGTKIAKQYRLLWRAEGLAGYRTVTAEGTETLLIHPDGSQFVNLVSGLCSACAAGVECTWPDCPRRSSKITTRPAGSIEQVPDVPAPAPAGREPDVAAPGPERKHEPVQGPVLGSLQGSIQEWSRSF
jgi:hypothetical protein